MNAEVVLAMYQYAEFSNFGRKYSRAQIAWDFKLGSAEMITDPATTHCVILNISFIFSDPSFPHLQNGADNTFFPGKMYIRSMTAPTFIETRKRC